MNLGDKKLIMVLLRGLPFIVLAVSLQVFGAILLVFVPAIVFPEQKWIAVSLMLPYFWWSTRCFYKYVEKLSKASL